MLFLFTFFLLYLFLVYFSLLPCQASHFFYFFICRLGRLSRLLVPHLEYCLHPFFWTALQMVSYLILCEHQEGFHIKTVLHTRRDPFLFLRIQIIVICFWLTLGMYFLFFSNIITFSSALARVLTSSCLLLSLLALLFLSASLNRSPHSSSIAFFLLSFLPLLSPPLSCTLTQTDTSLSLYPTSFNKFIFVFATLT